MHFNDRIFEFSLAYKMQVCNPLFRLTVGARMNMCACAHSCCRNRYTYAHNDTPV